MTVAGGRIIMVCQTTKSVNHEIYITVDCCMFSIRQPCVTVGAERVSDGAATRTEKGHVLTYFSWFVERIEDVVYAMDLTVSYGKSRLEGINNNKFCLFSKQLLPTNNAAKHG